MDGTGTQISTPAWPATDLSSWMEDRLIWVTGKGGTGKSAVASAIAQSLAARGRKVLLCEIDVQTSELAKIHGEETSFSPVKVAENLSIMNITWPESLVAYLRTVLPVPKLVRAVISNEVVRRFMDFTPGSREIVTLNVLMELRERFDCVVVDMPASGHAFALLDITRSALHLFRSGPVRRKVVAIRDMLTDARTRAVFVALPEQMVVNETLETYERFKSAGLLSGPPVVLLNQASEPARHTSDHILIDRLQALDLPHPAADFVAVGRWELDREEAVTDAILRLGECFTQKPLLLDTQLETSSPRATVDALSTRFSQVLSAGGKP